MESSTTFRYNYFSPQVYFMLKQHASQPVESTLSVIFRSLFFITPSLSFHIQFTAPRFCFSDMYTFIFIRSKINTKKLIELRQLMMVMHLISYWLLNMDDSYVCDLKSPKS